MTVPLTSPFRAQLENTIMLVTRDSSTDIANNAAIDFVKELDPDGERTVQLVS